MTQEEKDLLLKYLCMALPYEVIIEYNNDSCVETREMGLGSLHDFMVDNAKVKPYLRPMSSMTDEERNELDEISNGSLSNYDEYIGVLSNKCWKDSFDDIINGIDWLLEHHFDYRGLISKGLAIDCTDLNIY